MDYLTAALHNNPFRPTRAPAAYISDLFDLEARKSAFLTSNKSLSPAVPRGDDPEAAGALRDGSKPGTNGGMFYDVHGLIFDNVAPNIGAMVEAALGLPADTIRPSARKGMRWLDVLDLGCGKGVMGSRLRPLANYLTGVDLSEEAIKHATRTRTYDKIHHGDVATIIEAMAPSSYDLVVASDLFPYFGDLAEILRSIATVTRPGGLVAFSVDALDVEDDGGGKTFELNFTGRWSHRRNYVTQSVTAAGMYVLGVRAVKGHTRLVSPAAREIVLETLPQERKSTIFLCEKSVTARS